MALDRAEFELPRARATPQMATGGGRIGVGRAPIRVGTDYAFAGYSRIGKRFGGAPQTSVARSLYASALVVEDAAGHRFALVFADLWSGSRLVAARAALRLAGLGIGADELLLVGTHTHTGPGHAFGDSLYDELAQVVPGMDPAIVTGLVDAVAGAVAQACDDLAPGTLGTAVGLLWGVASNRSLPAFEANPEAGAWTEPGRPGAGAPDGMPRAAVAVDPRVRVIVAEQGGVLRGVFATFGCHATSLGKSQEEEDADWPGRARAGVARRLALAPDVIVAVAASAAGDVTPIEASALPSDDSLGPARCEQVGAQVALTIAALVPPARAAADAVTFTVQAGEWVPAAPVGAVPALPAWAYGKPALAGSEEGRTPLHALAKYREGNPKAPPAGPHGAKRVANLADELALCLSMDRVAPGARLPLHLVRLGGLTLVAVPGEPTVSCARHLALAIGAPDALVLHCAGAYAGYFTTSEEYAAQHYEGASTAFGPDTTAHLAATLVTLGAGGALPAPTWTFDTVLRSGRRLDLGAWDREDTGPAPFVATALPAPLAVAATRLDDGVVVTWSAPASPAGGGVPDVAALDAEGRRLAVGAGAVMHVREDGELGQRRTMRLRLDDPTAASRIVVGPDAAHAGFVAPVLDPQGAGLDSPQAAWAARPGLLAGLPEPLDGASTVSASPARGEVAMFAAAAAESKHDEWVRHQRERLAAARAAGFTFRNDRAAIPLVPEDLSFQGSDPRWVPTIVPAIAQELGPTQGYDARKPPAVDAWRYPLAAHGPTRVAVLGDFGAGVYYSRYVALQAASEGVHAVVHLGDVYAAGGDREIAQNLVAPLVEAGLLGAVPVYALPGNHELYAMGGPGKTWGGAYLEFLAASRKAHPAVQKQENSSFVVDVGATHRLVGVDTDWSRYARLDVAAYGAWLRDALTGARAAGRTTVLLTQNHPYDLDKSGTTALWKDLVEAGVRSLVDLWLWGNVHYAALYEPTEALPFWGVCTGHAGHPHKRIHADDKRSAPAPVLWVEVAGRFPHWTDVRQDQLANGFTTLDLRDDGGVGIRLIDWMGNLRVELDLERQPGGGPLRRAGFRQHAVPGKPAPP